MILFKTKFSNEIIQDGHTFENPSKADNGPEEIMEV